MSVGPGLRAILHPDFRDMHTSEDRRILRVRIGVVHTGLTSHGSHGVYGEVSGLGGGSGEAEGEQSRHECTEYVGEFVAGAG